MYNLVDRGTMITVLEHKLYNYTSNYCKICKDGALPN